MENQEVWVHIPGYDGYDASSLGRVRSYHTRSGKAWHIGDTPRRILSPSNRKKRPGVNVMGALGTEHRRIQVLVTLAFLGPCPEGMEICHYDGDTTNNCIENLRYDTRENNDRDRERHINERRGKEVRAIRGRYASGESTRVLAGEFGYSEDHIRRIGNGSRMAYLGGPVVTGFRNLKVTEKERTAIKERYNVLGTPQYKLAEQYGISISYVSRICSA